MLDRVPTIHRCVDQDKAPGNDFLCCVAQVEARKTAPKSTKKVEKPEPLFESASDSEQECADKEDDSSSASPDSDTNTAAKSGKACKSARRTPRTVRASSKKAAKAIAAACIDLEDDASDKHEPPNTSDSEPETEPNESSPPAAATVVQKKSGSRVGSQNKNRMISESPSWDSDVEKDGIETNGGTRKGRVLSSPEGSSVESLEEGFNTKSAKKSSSDDKLGGSDTEPKQEVDPDANSPIPVMLKSRKLQKADGGNTQFKADDSKRGATSVLLICACVGTWFQ